jgi:hypothetical protein
MSVVDRLVACNASPEEYAKAQGERLSGSTGLVATYRQSTGRRENKQKSVKEAIELGSSA